MKKPLLFLSPRVPWPLNTGAKIRTHALLSALRERFEVHYAGFVELSGGCLATEAYLENLKVVHLIPEQAVFPPGKAWLALRTLMDRRPATIAKYWEARLAHTVRRWMDEHPGGIVHADHLHMAPYLSVPGPATLRVMDEHNVESVILERLAGDGCVSSWSRPYLRLQAARMRTFEGAMARRADLALAVSEEDATQLRQMAPQTRIEVIPNGVDLDTFTLPPDGHSPRPGRLIFTGSMNWLPNQQAVFYFVREILPLLDRHHARPPGWSLDIVGHAPPAPVRALASERVRVSGTVPDVRPWIREAEVYVVPLRVGGGSRLKILEAFAMGIPVVSTRVGCEGLGAVDGEHLLVADTPATFAQAVARLADEPELRDKLTKKARKYVESRFGWPSIGEKLAGLYEQLTP